VTPVLLDRRVLNELLVYLLVLVHRTCPGDLLNLANDRIQVVIRKPRIQIPDCVTELRFEYSRRPRVTGVSPPLFLLVTAFPSEGLERPESGTFGIGVLV
jgi:hypothetical protein